MDTERQFLHGLSAHISNIQILSQVLRWGHEGCLREQKNLPEVAIELQECSEKVLALVRARKISIERYESHPEPRKAQHER